MSRSYKKLPIAGNTTSPSEKRDKSLANRRLRRNTKQILQDIDEDEEEQTPLPEIDDVSNVWSFNKDGKRWYGALKDWRRLFKVLRK